MIMHVVGNRPQFIKLAPLSREFKKRGYKDVIVHTGQHYDDNMSDIFFLELGIEKPFRNLMIGSGTHAYITGKALIELEKIMIEVKPEIVVVYGDTNSTLAAALAAVKLDLPIVHIEAGPRTYVNHNPEEINRRMVDHISTILCCPDKISVNNLKKENLVKGVSFTGDIMYDTFLYCKENEKTDTLSRLHLRKNEYALMTWHRQENTADRERMARILEFVGEIGIPVLCPMHPRTKKMLQSFQLWEKAQQTENFQVLSPVGYLEMITLMNNSRFIICDSGGVSKESYFAGKKCFFMLPFSPWKELVDNGTITTIDFNDPKDWKEKTELVKRCPAERIVGDDELFGSGDTAKRIVDILESTHLI